MVFPAPAPAASGGRPLRLSYENVARILYGRLDEGFTGIQRRFLRDLFQLQDEQVGRAALNRVLNAAGGGQAIPAPGSAQWNALTDELRTIAAEHQVLFNEQAQAVIRSAAEAAGQAVPEVAGLAAGNRPALRAAWNQVDPLAVEAAMTTMHRPAFEQAVRNYGDQFVTAAQSVLVAGLASGQGPRATAAQLRRLIATMPAQSATTMARTLQMNAYRSATAMHQRANSRVLSKQIRVAALDARCCAACLALHGKEYPIGEEIVDHANGRCIGVAIPRGSEVTVESGPDWLDRQPETVQQQILGRAGWNAWRAGAVRLDQFVGYRTDPIWGRQTVQRSLRGILGQDTAARYYSRNQGRAGGSRPAARPQAATIPARATAGTPLDSATWNAYGKRGAAEAEGVSAIRRFTDDEYRPMRLAQRHSWEEIQAMDQSEWEVPITSEREYLQFRDGAVAAERVLADQRVATYAGRIQRSVTPEQVYDSGLRGPQLAEYLQTTPGVFASNGPLQTGKTFAEGALSSWSRNPDDRPGGLVFLHVQENRSGVSVEAISRHQHEQEILMPSSAVFRVQSVTPVSALPASHPLAQVNPDGVVIELVDVTGVGL